MRKFLMISTAALLLSACQAEQADETVEVKAGDVEFAATLQEKLLDAQAGDIIEVPIDTKLLYGERDESLVFTDRIENVPEEYHEIGMTITMENEKGEPRSFIVTRFDDKTLTVDGNNPLCGRDVTFVLEVLSIRDATDEEIDLGGAVGADPDINEILERAE